MKARNRRVYTPRIGVCMCLGSQLLSQRLNSLGAAWAVLVQTSMQCNEIYLVLNAGWVCLSWG